MWINFQIFFILYEHSENPVISVVCLPQKCWMSHFVYHNNVGCHKLFFCTHIITISHSRPFVGIATQCWTFIYTVLLPQRYNTAMKTTCFCYLFFDGQIFQRGEGGKSGRTRKIEVRWIQIHRLGRCYKQNDDNNRDTRNQVIRNKPREKVTSEARMQDKHWGEMN